VIYLKLLPSPDDNQNNDFGIILMALQHPKTENCIYLLNTILLSSYTIEDTETWTTTDYRFRKAQNEQGIWTAIDYKSKKLITFLAINPRTTNITQIKLLGETSLVGRLINIEFKLPNQKTCSLETEVISSYQKSDKKVRLTTSDRRFKKIIYLPKNNEWIIYDRANKDQKIFAEKIYLL